MRLALKNILNGAGGLNPDGLALDLQFAADKTLTARRGPSPILTRTNNVATFVGSNGLIQSAGTDIPRFDHDPVSPFACRGLLIEEGRTNLVLQSENHPSASWNKTGGSVASVVNTAPDGSANSNLFSEDSSTGNHRLFQSTAYVSGTSYAISVFLKFAGRQFIAITHPAVANGTAIFDIQNGSITLQQSGITASIVQYPNGWWRCVVNGLSSVTSSQSHTIQGSTTGGFLTASYTGLNGPAFYIYGSQIEAGSFPTSYIPTTTSTLARSADVCSITAPNFATFYNQPEGTFLSNSSQPFITAANAQVYAADNGTDAERFNLRHQTSFAVTQTGGTTQSIVDFIDPTANAVSKIAYAYANANYSGARNGTLGTSSPNLTVPTVNRIFIGSKGHSSSEYLNGHIAVLRYYKKRLPNAKLQALTA